MKLTELFAGQLEREVPICRRVLERVPEGRNGFKPHEKSMAMGYLSALVASMPAWIEMAVLRDELDLGGGGGGYRPQEPKTVADLLRSLDESAERARKALAGTNDDHLGTPWRLAVGGRVVSENPRREVIFDTFTHLAHHRGQLTVYLRLNEALVPSVYGPSADDRSF